MHARCQTPPWRSRHVLPLPLLPVLIALRASLAEMGNDGNKASHAARPSCRPNASVDGWLKAVGRNLCEGTRVKLVVTTNSCVNEAGCTLMTESQQVQHTQPGLAQASIYTGRLNACLSCQGLYGSESVLRKGTHLLGCKPLSKKKKKKCQH